MCDFRISTTPPIIVQGQTTTDKDKDGDLQKLAEVFHDISKMTEEEELNEEIEKPSETPDQPEENGQNEWENISVVSS